MVCGCDGEMVCGCDGEIVCGCDGEMVCGCDGEMICSGGEKVVKWCDGGEMRQWRDVVCDTE